VNELNMQQIINSKKNTNLMGKIIYLEWPAQEFQPKE
jgi:hypothetical protein